MRVLYFYVLLEGTLRTIESLAESHFAFIFFLYLFSSSSSPFDPVFLRNIFFLLLNSFGLLLPDFTRVESGFDISDSFQQIRDNLGESFLFALKMMGDGIDSSEFLVKFILISSGRLLLR